MKGIHEMESRIKNEPRWPPALAILVVIFLLAVLPHHVQVMPVWVFHLAALAVLVVMAAITLTPANALWQRIERILIIILAVAYIANTIVELANMIGVITIHPSKSNARSPRQSGRRQHPVVPLCWGYGRRHPG
jgi:hypothetical protein